jgi:hypothetical protein
MGFLTNLVKSVQASIDQPAELLSTIAAPTNATQLERCAPGTAVSVIPNRADDLIGLYEAGKLLYGKVFDATTPEEVIELLHPDHILPARTYLRMITYTEGQPASNAVYGIAANSSAYGPNDGQTVKAYVLETNPGSPGQELFQFIELQQTGNNEVVDPC